MTLRDILWLVSLCMVQPPAFRLWAMGLFERRLTPVLMDFFGSTSKKGKKRGGGGGGQICSLPRKHSSLSTNSGEGLDGRWMGEVESHLSVMLNFWPFLSC